MRNYPERYAFHLLKSLYACLLVFSSLAYGLTFQFAYFCIPLATLCFPVLFLLAAILADQLPIHRCLKFLVGCSFINLIVVGMLSRFVQVELNEFWINHWHTQHQIYGILSLGYHLALIACVSLVYLWRSKKHKFNYITVTIAAIVANGIDLTFMWPALFSYADDSYIATWKLLTVATFKLNVLLLSLPLAWGVLWLQRYIAKRD